jgi:benzoyl-CoA reductase/2-hydroxyglutaryl-CoA dehydratase subunit BcrC/BadD/HgdB
MPRNYVKPVVGWTCTYLPLEILEAGEIQPLRIIPSPSSEKADAYLDPNYCPYIKSVLGEALQKRYSSISGIVLINTCDGMRRLYDALRFYSPPSFCYLLDVPRVEGPLQLAISRRDSRNLRRMLVLISK